MGDILGIVDINTAIPFTGTTDKETVIGTAGDELIFIGSGNDVIYGNGGDDVVVIDSTFEGEARWDDMTPGDILRLQNGDCQIDITHLEV